MSKHVLGLPVNHFDLGGLLASTNALSDASTIMAKLSSAGHNDYP